MYALNDRKQHSDLQCVDHRNYIFHSQMHDAVKQLSNSENQYSKRSELNSKRQTEY